MAQLIMDRQKRLLVSYDTQQIALQKADYINKMGLGGAMWWELDADKAESTGKALVRTVKEALVPLEQRQNELHYPGSSASLSSRFRLMLIQAEYDNLRKGMQ